MTTRRARSQAERNCYDIGGHLVRLTPAQSGWTVSVDGLGYLRRYRTQGEAWSAGVAVAEALDAGAGLGAPGRPAESAQPSRPCRSAYRVSSTADVSPSFDESRER